ncbi:alpha/beta hydrolase family protein [Adhaeribacter pallidiroseus]|uniref:Dienelactone hydrolase n=1 Tax=Adhaeribacter pallidiroseus TaxID=2072847 RepID=A0A369QCP3_9BACT|nr:dienelactone hydrolase [Adhaeribacter pallidiroseus]RDC62110.1 hypothetical protein AHMF7616_00701 [Adhaeribacter pallidiroseus]
MQPALIILFLFLVPSATFASTNPEVPIGERTFTFHDPSRNRPVITEVWYPTPDTLRQTDKHFSPFTRRYTVRNGKLVAGKKPLILLSHGTGGGRLTLEWFAQALVQNGFIVAAVDHWGNTYDNKIPLEFLKPWERPLDISFALSGLIRDPEFGKIIDPQKIGAAGYSYGGYTVIALAGAILDYKTLVTFYKTTGHKELEIPELPGLANHLDDNALLTAKKHLPSLKDNRIKAYFAIAPALGAGFTTKKQFQAVNQPVYLVVMQSDSMAPVQTNARHYHQLLVGSKY